MSSKSHRRISPVPRIHGLPAPRLRDGAWAAYGGLPFIIEGVASEWRATRKWDADYLIDVAGDDTVTPFVTSKALQGTVLQQINQKAELTFREFVDHIYGRKRVAPGVNYYLRVEPGSVTYDTLARDIQIPDIGREFNPDWSGIWMGHTGNATPFHNDQWHGLLFQVSGRKRYLMVHPFDAPVLQESWPARAKYDLAHADIVEEDDPILQELEIVYQGVLEPGEVMYVPPFWMHQFVTLDDGNISLPIRFNTTQTPHVSLYQLSQNSALRHLTNQPVKDRATILRFLADNRKNFFALEREFVEALIEVRGLSGDDPSSLLRDVAQLGDTDG